MSKKRSRSWSNCFSLCANVSRACRAPVTVRATLLGGVPAYSSIASTNPQRSAVEAGTRRIDSAI